MKVQVLAQVVTHYTIEMEAGSIDEIDKKLMEMSTEDLVSQSVDSHTFPAESVAHTNLEGGDVRLL